MFVRSHIPLDRRGVWFRRGDPIRLLRPGTHVNPRWLWHGGNDVVETFDVNAGKFSHPRLEALLTLADLRDELLVVDLPQDRRALIWRDGRLFDLLGPGVAAYWRAAGEWRVETFDVSDIRFGRGTCASCSIA